jgi:hypothetical protein
LFCLFVLEGRTMVRNREQVVNRQQGGNHE